MNAEFALLVYHQLICMSDSYEEQELLSAEQKIIPIEESWGIPSNAEMIRTDLPAEVPALSPVTPRDNRPKDTDKTIYRWNHVPDNEWVQWGISARGIWIDYMLKKYGKSVVA